MRSLILNVILMSWNIVTTISQIDSVDQDESNEYCQPGEFVASCGPEDVIVMSSAKYGRMRIGKCVKRDYGNQLGCSADVLSDMDRRCSGRHECAFDIDLLHGSQPCPEDLTSYLEATYDCLPVVQAQERMCNLGEAIILTEPSGTIANVITEDAGYGSEECPWMIQAKPGQHINITLINFARVSTTAIDNDIDYVGSRPRICYQYATIREQGVRRTITECEGGPRESRAYLTSSHQVEISILSRKAVDTYYLLQYRVLGCADPPIPRGSWKKRVGKLLVVQCNHTDQSWSLTCDGDKWTGGPLGNCSRVTTNNNKVTTNLLGDEEFPYGILIVVAIGVALGVFFGGILLTLASFYMKRKRQENNHTADLTGERIYNFPPDGDKRPEPGQFTYDPRLAHTTTIDSEGEPKELFTYPDPSHVQTYGYIPEHGFVPAEHIRTFRPGGHIYESPSMRRKGLHHIQHTQIPPQTQPQNV